MKSEEASPLGAQNLLKDQTAMQVSRTRYTRRGQRTDCNYVTTKVWSASKHGYITGVKKVCPETEGERWARMQREKKEQESREKTKVINNRYVEGVTAHQYDKTSESSHSGSRAYQVFQRREKYTNIITAQNRTFEQILSNFIVTSNNANVTAVEDTLFDIGKVLVEVPPSYGPAVNNALILTGGIVEFFANDSPPTQQMLTNIEFNSTLETLLNNHIVNQASHDHIDFSQISNKDINNTMNVVKKDFRTILALEKNMIKASQKYHEAAAGINSTNITKNDFDNGAANLAAELTFKQAKDIVSAFAKQMHDKIEKDSGELSPENVAKMVTEVDAQKNQTGSTAVTAAMFFQELLLIRVEVYHLHMIEAVRKDGQFKGNEIRLAQNLKKDMDAYEAFAREFFVQDKCLNEMKYMHHWDETDHKRCIEAFPGESHHTRENQQCCWFFRQQYQTIVYSPKEAYFYLKGVGNNNWTNSMGNQKTQWGAAVEYEYDEGDIPVPGDYYGEGFKRFAIWRPGNGYWYIQGKQNHQWGINGDIPVPANYYGNGLNIAVFRPSTGIWYIYGQANVHWGGAGDIPVPADYHGLGKDEIACFRPNTGYWYIINMAPISFGAHGDIPVPGDYTGDGNIDLAVFRPREGSWYIRGQASGVAWGQAGDIPVPADWFQEGKMRLTLFRPQSGEWFFKSPLEDDDAQTEISFKFGQEGDIPFAF